MAAEIVNLRMARKRRNRADREKTAEQNRIEHGRSKAERKLTDALNTQSKARHDNQRLEKPRDPGSQQT